MWLISGAVIIYRIEVSVRVCLGMNLHVYFRIGIKLHAASVQYMVANVKA
jgi:hypothetical protein